MRDLHGIPALGERLVDSILSYPKRYLSAALLLVCILLPGMQYLTADFTHTGFFYPDDPKLLAFEKFERQFGNDDSLVMVVHSPSGIFDEDSVKLIGELTEAMWLLPDIIRVTSLANYSWVHAEGDDILVEPFIPEDEPLTQALLEQRKKIALEHENIPNYLISPDAKTALIYAALRPSLDSKIPLLPIVRAARALKEKSQRTDHVLYVYGGPAVTGGFEEATQNDLERLIPIVIGLIVLWLGVCLRSIRGIFLAFSVVICSLLGAFSVLGWFNFSMTSMTGILPQIIIAIGVADAVHILVVFRQGRGEGLEPLEATRYTLLKNFQPTLLTSISTSIGFFSFASSNLKSLATLGIVAGFSVLFAWLFTYFVLGPLLVLAPLPASRKEGRDSNREERIAKSFVRLLNRFKRPILIFFTLIAVLSCFASTQNSVNADPFKYFAPGYPVRDANDFLTEVMGGAGGFNVVIRTGQEEGIKDPALLLKVDAYQAWVESLPYVTQAVSIVDVLKATNRSLHGDKEEFYKVPDTREAVSQELFLYTMSLPQGMDINHQVTVRNDALRMTVLWTIFDSESYLRERDVILAKGREMGLDVVAVGKGEIYQSMNSYVVDSFIRSISIAMVLVTFLLMFVFKSVRIGLIALIPNCLPLIFGGAFFYLFDKPLDIGTVLVMSVCLGIAVDDTIHMLANYNRLVGEGLSHVEALTELFSHTSPALIVTTLILASGFGTLAFADFIPNMYFGIMTALILSSALITDLLFLPLLLEKMNFGRKPSP
ncbi:MAG: MMPL family transporter [Deltaproteobacteria bacterium]|nr:MMPL family transporter [Deltaproteobacteria bacterium]